MARFQPDGLALRSLSAAVLAPPVLAAVHFGSPWFEICIIAGVLAMAWEWGRMCGGGKLGAAGWILAAGLTASASAAAAGAHAPALAATAAAAAVAAGFRKNEGIRAAAFFALGGLSIGLFGTVFLWMRGLDGGRDLVFWIVGAVWCTDVGAYAAGRLLGGPKLAPLVSPGKTWAGLAGGVAASAVWSLSWLSADPARAAAAGAGAALLAQAGDLAVSAAKRRCGVKDAGGMIPGHGGMLDRLDGMLLTGPAAAALTICGA